MTHILVHVGGVVPLCRVCLSCSHHIPVSGQFAYNALQTAYMNRFAQVSRPAELIHVAYLEVVVCTWA